MPKRFNYPREFVGTRNFELAFERVARGSNREYKQFYLHLIPWYRVALEASITDLIDDISQGRYAPAEATLVFHPKPSGILRPLRILSLRDLIVYQAIINIVASRFRQVQNRYALVKSFGAVLSGKGSSFFYRNWKRCYQRYNAALTRAYRAGNVYVADFDLVSFYELIDHNQLRALLEKRLRSKDLLDLLFTCLEKWTTNRAGAHCHHGIPQGPISSAFLAECFLFRFDGMAFKNVHYLRYVDDIKLMARNEVPLRRALLRLDICCKEVGLVPQAQKIELRKVSGLRDLLKAIPSGLATLAIPMMTSHKTQQSLLRMFRGSLRREKGSWVIEDPTQFKFSLLRLAPRKGILKRVTPISPLKKRTFYAAVS